MEARTLGEENADYSLTQRQIENIFPEFRARLKLYDNCCDASGKVVKNFEYFKWYKSQEFEMIGDRGGKANKEDNKNRAGNAIKENL